MSLWVVVGGQFGGEGKGKISAFIARQEEIAPEIEIDPRRSAARRAERRIGVDGRNAHADAQEGAEEEPVEEVVLERELPDWLHPAENPSPDSSRRID